ncbi:hypothetical protein UFOVP735_21 [uncultured Caudovirales phage]|uniref:Uncharacterized protein n=1 Tax=uncultured Caudovirales phage TaxID=2100421 RepID=A0A6J7X9H2_9CAUD|nr:hypothetical protein UFOVP735_21 [uncultured Caudovirales phage]
MSDNPELPDDDEPEIEFEFSEETLLVIPDDEVIEVDMSFGANLVPALEQAIVDDIGSIRQDVLTNFKNSRQQWEEKIKKGIQFLGLNTEGEGNTEVEGACTAVHPLLIENVVKFQAKAIQELWPARGPVRTRILGYTDPTREQAAARVKAYMNHQLVDQVAGFYSDLERNLFRVGFMGVGIRKAGWNSLTGTPEPAVVYAENFYIDPASTHLKDADEYIEVMELSPRKMRALVDAGTFIQPDDNDSEDTLEPNEITEALARAQGFDMSLERKGFTVGEAHCYLDLEGADLLLPEGGMAPYIVHFNVKTGNVYSIKRNWREGDNALTKRLWYTIDHCIPAFGFWSLGYVHLIGDLTASSTVALRALVDSGQYANWQAGFKSQDAKFSDSDTPLGFGEWRDVNLSPEELAKAFFPMPAKEPSQVLFSLLKYMVDSGQKFADAADEVVAGSSNYGPVATTLALLETSQRFYSSIHKRLHQSQGEFLKLIGELNYENLPDTVNFVVNSENQYVQRTDFDPAIVDVLPASDPNALTESQRVARAQVELEMAARFPQLHDMREALRRFYSAMGTENIDKLLVDPEAQAVSADPLTEIRVAMSGKPIKAQLGQNHMAHIAVKEAFLKAPQMQGTNDPTVAVGMQLLIANIAEHKVLMFVAQAALLAQQMGMPIQDENVQAQIATQLLMISAQSAPGGEQGPSAEQQMIELNKAELQLSAARIQSQDVREAAKIALKNRELDLKEAGMLLDAEDKNKKNQIAASGKILDSSAKLADLQAATLAQRANQGSV